MSKSKESNKFDGLLRIAMQQRRRLSWAVVLVVIGQGQGLVPYFVLSHIITVLVQTPVHHIPPEDFVQPLVIAAVAIIMKHCFIGIASAFSHAAAYDILYDLRIAISQKMLHLPLGYFGKRNSGQLKKVMSEDVEQMEIFLAHNLPDFLGAVIYMLLAAIALFAVDWRMALATTIFVPIGFGFVVVGMNQGEERTAAWFDVVEKMSHVMIEYIQGMPVIKAFNHTVTSFSKFSDTLQESVNIENESSRCWYLSMAIFSVFLTINLLCVIPLGAILYSHSDLSLGSYVFFILLSIGFGSPMWVLLQFGRGMVTNVESQARIDAILDAPELPESERVQLPGQPVSTEKIEFSYDGKTKAIDGIDCVIPPESFVALVGPSGAGKTTLARLLPRFWDVDAGVIRMGDADIRDISLNDLMDQYGFIFQSVYLYNDTVMANLRIGNPSATEAEVHSAAKTACCHDFIMELPEGYQTVVGERGARISGGEKQRLSIARALLKDAPVLILDEATAFIDPENEAQIQQSINSLVANKTLIAIAHRLSTIVAADQILVIDQGRIVARGTHLELLETSRLYKTMWDSHMAAQGWALEGEAC